MRLEILAHAEKLRARFMLGLIEFIMRKDSPLDVPETVYPKQEYFGDRFLAIANEALRGPCDWTAGARELFAPLPSKQSGSPFCVKHHAAIVALARGGAGNAERASTTGKAPRSTPRGRRPLRSSRRWTAPPGGPKAADIDAARQAGVRGGAIEDALPVAFTFHIINRLASAFDFHLASPETNTKVGARLLKNGYKL